MVDIGMGELSIYGAQTPSATYHHLTFFVSVIYELC